MWWSERNFSFSSVEPSHNNGTPEFYGRAHKYPIGYERHKWWWERQWLGFDEDDGQAMEVFAAECQGWLFGERFYEPAPRDDDEGMEIWLELYPPSEEATGEAVIAKKHPRGAFADDYFICAHCMKDQHEKCTGFALDDVEKDYACECRVEHAQLQKSCQTHEPREA